MNKKNQNVSWCTYTHTCLHSNALNADTFRMTLKLHQRPRMKGKRMNRILSVACELFSTSTSLPLLLLEAQIFNFFLFFLQPSVISLQFPALGCFYIKMKKKTCREGRDEGAASTAARSQANLQPADLHTRISIIALKQQQ